MSGSESMHPFGSHARCDCGKSAPFPCYTFHPPGPISCHKPLCDAACKLHRHESGSMGYSASMAGKATFLGFVPDGPGLWYWLANKWRQLTYSPERTARYTWEREVLCTPPPAPLPTKLTLFIGAQIWVCTPEGVEQLHKQPSKEP